MITIKEQNEGVVLMNGLTVDPERPPDPELDEAIPQAASAPRGLWIRRWSAGEASE
ncbi:MAG: hypothetical protein M3360_00740 [Actinomycetota bacterium]|nr:hypothetical protein [Actinomycetota bacterium]